MTLAYTIKLDFINKKINVRAQKINDSSLKIYSIVSANFLLQDSLDSTQFFEETLLLADISIEVVLGILFLLFNNTNVKFAKLKKLTWRL